MRPMPPGSLRCSCRGGVAARLRAQTGAAPAGGRRSRRPRLEGTVPDLTGRWLVVTEIALPGRWRRGRAPAPAALEGARRRTGRRRSGCATGGCRALCGRPSPRRTRSTAGVGAEHRGPAAAAGRVAARSRPYDRGRGRRSRPWSSAGRIQRATGPTADAEDARRPIRDPARPLSNRPWGGPSRLRLCRHLYERHHRPVAGRLGYSGNYASVYPSRRCRRLLRAESPLLRRLLHRYRLESLPARGGRARLSRRLQRLRPIGAVAYEPPSCFRRARTASSNRGKLIR